jgi:hypothetical protein
VSPIDAAIIRRKLQRITGSLDGLRPIARLSLEEYRARFYERSKRPSTSTLISSRS